MKLKIATLLFLVLTLGFACKMEDKTTPEYATKAFIEAFNKGDFPNIYKHTPAKEHIIIEQIEKMMNEDKDRYEKVKKNRVEIISVTCKEASDSTAVCHGVYKLNGQEKSDDFSLKKEDDHWCVRLSL